MSKKRRLFSFYILHGLFARLKAMAKKEDCSISSLLETASSEFLDRRESDTKALLNEIEDMPYAKEFAKQTDAAMKGRKS